VIMANMSDSQFKTFRADVRREVRNVSDEIRSNIHGAVVAEARSVAASTARKTEETLVRNMEHLTKLQNRGERLHEDLVRTLDNLSQRLNTQADVTVTKWPLHPGVGVMMRWNYGVHAMQIPLVFTLSFTDFMRVYAGPVITIGSCAQPDSDTAISPSFFPGVAGVSFSLPSFSTGKVKVRIIQDICYTVFNDTDGSALPFVESVTAGLVFSTGIRVTFPLSVFTK